MKRRPMSWRIVALSSVVALAVVALGAGAGLSAPSGPSASTLVDGTTDSITNLDPAGSYDYGTQTLMGNVYEHLLDFRARPEAGAIPGHEVLLGREPGDVALQPSPRRRSSATVRRSTRRT